MNEQTADSIASAKAHMLTERRKLEAETGVRILDNGVVQLPPFTIGCPHPGCRVEASAQTDGAAVRRLAEHLVKVHHARGQA